MKKITVGFVVQEFDGNGNCISSEFIAGDEVSWEDQDGEPVIPPQDFYFPFEMKQPEDCSE